jgi:hypothetical protein
MRRQHLREEIEIVPCVNVQTTLAKLVVSCTLLRLTIDKSEGLIETSRHSESLLLRRQNPDMAGKLVLIEPHENSVECY